MEKYFDQRLLEYTKEYKSNPLQTFNKFYLFLKQKFKPRKPFISISGT